MSSASKDPPLQPRPAPVELTSWKEIASYLGVSVRTAQLWEEQRGLPVRRLPGPRGRVLLCIAELEAWKHSGGIASEAAGINAVAIPASIASRLKRLRPAYAGAAAVLIGVVVLAFVVTRAPATPASARVQGSALVAFSAGGKELWRKHFESLSPLMPPSRVWTGDLDGDGAAEVLFAPIAAEGLTETIWCYGERGDVRWKFSPGRTVRTATRSYTGTYSARAFAVTRPGRSRRRRILLSSSHAYFPSQVVLLSSEGAVEREYWHAGHLEHVRLADLDRDGTEEFYLGGINNAAKAATLVVLDADHFAGAAKEANPEYAFEGLGEAKERARIIFPRTCINRLNEPFNIVQTMQFRSDGLAVAVAERLSATEALPVVYQFTPALRLNDVGTSSWFDAEHERLHASGILDHALSPSEVNALTPVTVTPPPASKP
ncbi:MAG TPA: hypothetical protein VN428_20420 [Bryobacteraceae bacterium]|nr:hypothetical protein [Bryobacteraceae bacterium]